MTTTYCYRRDTVVEQASPRCFSSDTCKEALRGWRVMGAKFFRTELPFIRRLLQTTCEAPIQLDCYISYLSSGYMNLAIDYPLKKITVLRRPTYENVLSGELNIVIFGNGENNAPYVSTIWSCLKFM